MNKDLPTFDFYTVYCGAYPDEEERFWDDVHGLSNFSETASEEDLRGVLKSLEKEAKRAHKYEDDYSGWDIYNVNWALIDIINNRPEVAGNVLDIIDGYYQASTFIDDHSRWTIEAIGCLGEKELAKRATRLLGRFEYNNDREHREALGIPEVKSPIDNILNAYNGDPLFQQILKRDYLQGTKDKLEASRKEKSREKRRNANIVTDPLAYKKQKLEEYNRALSYCDRSYEELGDIGKTGNSKTGEVSYAQKSRAKELTNKAKAIIKNNWKAKITAKLDPSKNQENGSNDYLATKQDIISGGLEERRLSKKDMGKTGNSSTGEITKKDERIAKSQIEDAKYTMLQRRKLQNRE